VKEFLFAFLLARSPDANDGLPPEFSVETVKHFFRNFYIFILLRKSVKMSNFFFLCGSGGFQLVMEQEKQKNKTITLVAIFSAVGTFIRAITQP
jgi:hypothetical protein